jgi:hypothetical protein
MKRVFYISPVGADSEYEAKRTLLAQIARKRGLEFFFPLDHNPSFSIASALSDLAASDLIIADLSLERPSCYFEVGLAQAVGRHVVLIASEGTMLHQAGGTERVATYTDLASYKETIEWALSHLPGGEV